MSPSIWTNHSVLFTRMDPCIQRFLLFEELSPVKHLIARNHTIWNTWVTYTKPKANFWPVCYRQPNRKWLIFMLTWVWEGGVSCGNKNAFMAVSIPFHLGTRGWFMFQIDLWSGRHTQKTILLYNRSSFLSFAFVQGFLFFSGEWCSLSGLLSQIWQMSLSTLVCWFCCLISL